MLLNIWQKPKDSFRTPTYNIGGSNSSLTRQGGYILIKLFVFRLGLQASMFLETLKYKKVSDFKPSFKGYSIEVFNDFLLKKPAFPPKALITS